MLDTLVTAFVTFFVVLDPVGTVPIFIAMTPRVSAADRRRMAVRATLVAGGVIIAFAVVGEPLLRILGISLSAFRVAGGILLFLLAIDMVFVRHSGLRSTTTVEEEEASHREDISVFPLAIPLIAGPGAISSIILLMGREAGDVVAQTVVVVVVVVILALNLAALFGASYLLRSLGLTGVNVLSRVFGIVLAALSVQFVIDGIGEVFGLTVRSAG